MRIKLIYPNLNVTLSVTVSSWSEVAKFVISNFPEMTKTTGIFVICVPISRLTTVLQSFTYCQPFNGKLQNLTNTGQFSIRSDLNPLPFG